MRLPLVLSAWSSTVLGTGVALDTQAILHASPIKDIPLLGFGTWNLDKQDAPDAVAYALQTGYRHIDCAAAYKNEVQVGLGLKYGAQSAGLRRADYRVTSKLWNDHHKPELVAKALNQTLHDLGLEYIDLYLMHWPVASVHGDNKIDYLATWKAMTDLLSTQKVRHIGVSNFSPHQLKRLIASTPSTPPYAHQMELHPYLPQTSYLKEHRKHGIHVTAYSPLGNTNPTYGAVGEAGIAADIPPLLENKVIKDIAEARNCTPAQVALRWGMHRGTSVIPQATSEDHIEDNIATVKNCTLQAKDIRRMRKELQVKRFNNPSKGWGVHLFHGLQDVPEKKSSIFDLHGLRESVESYWEEVWDSIRGWSGD